MINISNRAIHCLPILLVITCLTLGEEELKKFTSPGAKNVYECGKNDLGDLTAYNTTQCPQVPCEFKLGTKSTHYYEIVLNEDHDALDLKLTSAIPGLEVPQQPYDVCTILVKDFCPLKKGQKYLFAVDLYAPNFPQFLGASFEYGAIFSNKVTKQSLCATLNAKFV